MANKTIRIAIQQSVQKNADRLKSAAPAALAVALASAALLPVVQQTTSAELALGAGIISGMGVEFLKGLGKDFIARLARKKDDVAVKELEKEILNRWNATGEKGVQFRQTLSEFLKRNGILQMALDAAPQDAREGMAQSLAGLANQFEEFGWVLDEIKETLAEIQKRQVEQLATQREQLDLQREQLAKTNLLLKLQRERKAKPAPAASGPQAEDLPPADIPCPYKGLASFQPEDAEFFFGREELTAQLLARLAGTTFLGVIGPSGSGKSSLVRAGLVPALWNGEIPGSADWKVLILRPGPSPLEEIAVRVALQSGISAASLRTDLRQDADALRLAIQQYLASQPEDTKFVLVIDQFEELFTQCENEDERAQFIAALVNTAQSIAGRMLVILTLRADFYGHCAAYPDLAGLLSANQVLVGAMSRDELRRAITLPAKQAGLALESGLVELVLQDAQGEAGALPMVSHAMMETWKRRSGHWLKVDAYQAFGGVRQAITSTAEEIYLAFNESERRQVRDIFLRLTRLDADASADARRRATLGDLVPAGADPAQTERILDRLADARLVVKDLGRDSEPEVEVAHEALIRHWERLRAWLDEDREALRLREGISDDARRWEAAERDESLLNHRGGRLEDALRLDENPTYALSERERAYLAACAELRDRQKRERERRVRWTVGASLAAAVIFLLLAGFGLVQRNEALSAQVNAEEQAYLAATAQANAEEQAQLAITAQTKAEEQAQLALARQLASKAQSIFISDDLPQQISVLLATHSMQISPEIEAAHILQTQILARPLAYIQHENNVTAVDFSPDGNYAVSGSKDGEIRIWDISSGRDFLRIYSDSGAIGELNQIQFSIDGIFLISASCDIPDGLYCKRSSARVWEVSSGKEISRVEFTGSINFSLSNDGKYIAVDNLDGILVWELTTGKRIAWLNQFGGSSSFVSFSPNDQLLVSSHNEKIVVWDIPSGKELISIEGNDYVNFIEFTPDGKFIVSDGGETIKVSSVATGQLISLLKHDDLVQSVDISADGKYVVTGSADATARVWELSSGREISRFTFGRVIHPIVYPVVFSPNGKYVFSSINGASQLWDAFTGKELIRISTENYYPYAKFSPDGNRLILSDEEIAHIWDVSKATENTPLVHEYNITAISISPDGKYVASGEESQEFKVWDASTGSEIWRSSGYWITSVEFTNNGKVVAISGCNERDNNNDEGLIRVLDISTGIELLQIFRSNCVRQIRFSADGNSFISGEDNKGASIWDTRTGEEILTVTHDSDVRDVTFSQDGKIAVSGDRKTIKVWEPTTGKEYFHIVYNGQLGDFLVSPDGKFLVVAACDLIEERNCLKGSAQAWALNSGDKISQLYINGWITSVDISPDSRYVVSGGEDGIVRVWEITSGLEIFQTTHGDSVFSVSFSPDGRYIVSASKDNTARIWDIQTGKEISRVNHQDWVVDVTFSKGGRYVLSSGFDRIARVWLWHPNDLVENACSRVSRNLTLAEWQKYIGIEVPYEIICDPSIYPNAIVPDDAQSYLDGQK